MPSPALEGDLAEFYGASAVCQRVDVHQFVDHRPALPVRESEMGCAARRFIGGEDFLRRGVGWDLDFHGFGLDLFRNQVAGDGDPLQLLDGVGGVAHVGPVRFVGVDPHVVV